MSGRCAFEAQMPGARLRAPSRGARIARAVAIGTKQSGAAPQPGSEFAIREPAIGRQNARRSEGKNALAELARSGGAARRAALVAALFAAGCMIDEDQRCDANMVLVKIGGVSGASETCGCVPGSIPDPRGYGCQLCGANETVQNNQCVCLPGYARLMAGGACEQSAIGTACTGDEGCPSSVPHCATDGAERYCSVQNCSATSCPAGYACEQASGSTYCGKLPAGLGKSCASDTDCAGGEATVCDAMMTHQCILAGCATGAVRCPGFYGCCDLSGIVPNFSTCVSPLGLMPDGSCPIGNLVMP